MTGESFAVAKQAIVALATDKGRPGGGGWDLIVEITPQLLKHCCQLCAEVFIRDSVRK